MHRIAALMLLASVTSAGSAAAQGPARSPKVDFEPRFPTARPAPLGPLYFTLATLQGLDVHSTTVALHRGHAEANPLMRWVAGNPAGLTAVKMASTAGFIYAAEKMRKKNRKAAVLFMAAANVANIFIVHHNYRVANRTWKRPASLPAPSFSRRAF